MSIVEFMMINTQCQLCRRSFEAAKCLLLDAEGAEFFGVKSGDFVCHDCFQQAVNLDLKALARVDAGIEEQLLKALAQVDAAIGQLDDAMAEELAKAGLSMSEVQLELLRLKRGMMN